MLSTKRKASSAAKAPKAKQQKGPPVKEEEKKKKKPESGGWLQNLVMQKRTKQKEMEFNQKRLRFIRDAKIKRGSAGVVYWMLRDQRVQGKYRRSLFVIISDCHILRKIIFVPCVSDNWALIFAQKLAARKNLPLHICFCLMVPKSTLSTLRHYSFMLKGLKEVAKVN